MLHRVHTSGGPAIARFTIIGERINMTRKSIRERVFARDAAFIAAQAKKQQAAGATHIDVNAGGDPAREVADMAWLTEVVAEATDLPLSFDSTNPKALEKGLRLCNRPGTIINSITGEKDRLKHILPLVKKHKTGVVALTMDDSGMPEDLEGRVALTRTIAAAVQAKGIGLDRVYFDHLVRPASTNPGQARHILEAIRITRAEFPEAHIALGLSNVSYGLPNRNNLNRAFLAMLVAAGADGAIIDPCEEGMITTLLSARAALGLDEFCMEYITAYREGKLGEKKDA
ncbi:MAG TPA: dihydropteroate synthase [Planctomycetota bacterium]|nr:dihydropteroate synthase [Planctomycetota bacterium]HRR79475.1 dihydropteroate synthase [Planctomycetota bacterium]HRT93331.1 dihydropteroate synthase [Planctomycetota bacterium]